VRAQRRGKLTARTFLSLTVGRWVAGSMMDTCPSALKDFV